MEPEPPTGGGTEGPPPGFWSFAFHTRFFPTLLARRLRGLGRTRGGFQPHTPIIPLAFCFLLVLFGIPNALEGGSILWWILGGLGVLGILTLIVHSIASGAHYPPTYDDFLVGVFLFFPVLGATGGIFVGALEHAPLKGAFLTGAGFVAGYLLGIPAGLWFQRLGWLAGLLDGLAGLAILGVILVDIVLLSGGIFG
jgi:hypothetical protein